MWPGSGYEGWFLVEGSVFGHAVDHVASAAGEADDGGVVVFALFAFALVVGDRGRVFGGRDERGLPQRVPEAFVAPSGGSLALDAGAGLAGGRSDAGVGGQVGRAFEVGDVAADAERDVACGPDAYPGHRRRDREKRVVPQELLDLAPDLAPPILDGLDVAGDRGDDGLGHAGAGHGDGLLADGLEHVVDDAAGAKPVGPGPVLHVLDPGPFHARGAAVPFEEREGRVAGGAFPFQDAFERGVGVCSSRLRRRLMWRVNSWARSSSWPASILSAARVSSSLPASLSVSGSLSAAHAITCASLRSVFASPGNSCAVLRMAVPGR